MSRTIKVAAIQMNAQPAPTAERLARAEQLVDAAAQGGAQLVVLPELFNTGYDYSDKNYTLAEPMTGPTATWLKETSARCHIHLAGTFMLVDEDEVYNALLLFAPDGRMWRYDKNYPWAWERAYFRDSQRITVAHTDLGDVGFMICADIIHLDLWKRYAGRVDLLVVCSCPPDVGNPTYHFPNGDRLTFDEMGPFFAPFKGTGRLAFGEMFNQQVAWLGAPAVSTVGSGFIQTDIPNSLASFCTMLPTAPWLIKYLPQASRMQMSCDFTQGTKVVDAKGRVLTELTQAQGETFTIAEVTLADKKPTLRGVQPASLLPQAIYLVSDVLLPFLSIPLYRRGLRRTWGERMAPVEASTRRWLVFLGLSLIAGLGLGLVIGAPGKGKK